MAEALNPFLMKYPDNRMAADLAFDVVEEANRMAVKANETQSLL